MDMKIVLILMKSWIICKWLSREFSLVFSPIFFLIYFFKEFQKKFLCSFYVPLSFIFLLPLYMQDHWIENFSVLCLKFCFYFVVNMQERNDMPWSNLLWKFFRWRPAAMQKVLEKDLKWMERVPMKFMGKKNLQVSGIYPRIVTTLLGNNTI